MFKQTLPCAEKNCRSKMTLTEKTDNLLYYNCVEKHDEHAFRYNIEQKKWEKIVIKSKLILHYNENPCEEPLIETSNDDNEFDKILDQFQETASTSELTEIEGINQKRAEELEFAGVKTVSDLAKTSAEQLSEKTGIPVTQISKWIIKANKLTETPSKIPA